jgi:branched-chain amino acid transport system permease protein
MRFAFKTSYLQDLGLFRDGVQRNCYLALLVGLLILPRLVPEYLVDIGLVFIYGLCGLSLMVLAGYTGLVSLGHAAFLGIGAYAHVYFTQTLGLPWIVSVALATALAAASGVVVGLPALRMTGGVSHHRHPGLRVIIQRSRGGGMRRRIEGVAADKPVIFGGSFG